MVGESQVPGNSENSALTVNRNLILTTHTIAPNFKMESNRFLRVSLNFGYFEKLISFF